MPALDSKGSSLWVKVSVTQSLSHFFPPVPFRKHGSTEQNIPLSEDATIPKLKKTQAGLSPPPRKLSSSEDSEDTNKEPSLSTQLLPVIKYSGQTSRVSASASSQSAGGSLLAAVSL